MTNDTATGNVGKLASASTDKSKERGEFGYICQLFDIKINAGFKDICCLKVQ